MVIFKEKEVFGLLKLFDWQAARKLLNHICGTSNTTKDGHDESSKMKKITA